MMRKLVVGGIAVAAEAIAAQRWVAEGGVDFGQMIELLEGEREPEGAG